MSSTDRASAISVYSSWVYVVDNTEGEFREQTSAGLGDGLHGDLNFYGDVTFGDIARYGDTTMGDILNNHSEGPLGNMSLMDILIELLPKSAYSWVEEDQEGLQRWECPLHTMSLLRVSLIHSTRLIRL